MTRNKIVNKATLVATVVTASVVVFAGAVLAAGGDDGGPIGPGPGRPRGFGGRGDHRRGGPLLILVAVVIATALITWFLARRRNADAPKVASAEAILSERLARSEISVDDYRTTLAALRETSSR